MVNKRISNKLPTNLPQLQNCIKRDASGYKEEFDQQYQHYRALLQVFQFNPASNDKSFQDLVMFLAQVSHCFPEELTGFTEELINLLKLFATNLNPEVRMNLCRALILMRNKSLVSATDLLSLFFELLKCNDKSLRQFLKTHIITDIRNVNSKHKNAKLNTVLQNFMFSMLRDSNKVAAKISLEIMIELYNKNVWKDPKTVNVIANACFSKITKILVTALTFFLGKDEIEEDSDESDSDEDNTPSATEVAMANKVNKKTKKRKRLLERTKKVIKKSKKKDKAVSFNFSAIHLIHDPQSMAEKLFKSLETFNERFEVKLMVMNFISRLVGIHELILLNFYPFLQRFLQPHQREVTKILTYTAQAAHELVPPDVIEPILKLIANNFVTERNSTEVMAVGLNSIRELCSRCPIVMNEDLLQDLAEYKSFRDKNVSMAAKSLIQLYRLKNPNLLKKKDRAKPTEATADLTAKQYGQVLATSYVDGAEALNESIGSDGEYEDMESDEEMSDNDSEGWINVSHSEDEGVLSEDAMNDTKDETTEEVTENSLPNDSKERAALITSSRILTQEEFKKIKAIQLSKQISASRPRKFNKNAKNDDFQNPSEVFNNKEIVSLNSIERLYKKGKSDKESRLETVREGREGREKFGGKKGKTNPFSSKNKKQNAKNKAFMMVKHKIKTKKKRSFQEKQKELKNRLLKKCKQIK